MTAAAMIEKAQQLEDSAAILYSSLLAHSMTESAMLEEAADLRAAAEVA